MKGLAMPHPASRPWVPEGCERHIQTLAAALAGPSAFVAGRIEALIERNSQIHDQDSFNLNPATNVMNPVAEAALARGLGSRPSLGYPGDNMSRGWRRSKRSRSSPQNWPPRCLARAMRKSGLVRACWRTFTALWRLQGRGMR